MKKIILLVALSTLIIGCSSNKNNNVNNTDDLSWLENKTNVTRCEYNGQVVYYVVSPCCDQYNYLYDREGNKICAPSGGFDGSGDQNCNDFSLEDESCEIIN